MARLIRCPFLPLDKSADDSQTDFPKNKDRYLFKRIHFAISFGFKVQSSKSFQSGILDSFWSIFKEKSPLAGINANESTSEVFKNKLESISMLENKAIEWIVYDVKDYDSKLLSIYVSLYYDSNTKTVQRFNNSFNVLMSVAVFWDTDTDENGHKNGEDFSKTTTTIVEHIALHFEGRLWNCHCKQIGSPEDGPFESLKLYREYALLSDLTNTKANLMGHQIIELVRRMRPEGLSEKIENHHNLSIQTCSRMYKLDLSLCMPSSSVAEEVLPNCPCLNTLAMRFRNLDSFKLDQMFWKVLFGLTQLSTLRIAYASIDLSILEQVSIEPLMVSPVRTLTLERVDIVIQPAEKVEGQGAAQLVARTLLRIFPDVQHVTLVFTDLHLTVMTRYYLRQLKPEVENLEIEQENSYRYK